MMSQMNVEDHFQVMSKTCVCMLEQKQPLMERLEKYEGGMDTQRSMRHFTGWVLLSQALGLTAVVLVGVWTGVYLGGFAWTEQPMKEFNYHPLFMVIGLVFLYGDALLVYRVFRNDRKVYVKILHAALLFFSLIFAVVGLKAVFDSHNLASPPMTNMYTLHSWVGLATVILFALQWVCGFITFLFPGLRMDLKSAYKPIHVFWGLTILAGAVMSCVLGILEKVFFSAMGSTELDANRVIAHCLAMVIVAMGIVVAYIVTRDEYARNPSPEEDHIQLTE